jgi:hypothetical protein
MNNVFKFAVLNAVRVQTTRGALSAEQLNQLSIKELTVVATKLAETLNKSKSSLLDFLDSAEVIDEAAQVQFELVKEIIQHKQAIVKAQTNKAVIESERKELDQLIAAKEAEAKSGLSLEELKAMRSKL